MKVIFPAQLLKVASRSDRTYVLTFNTRELRGIDAAGLLDDLMNEGWLIWSSENNVGERDIPEEKPDAGTGQKTQAQRIRGALYRLWEQGGQKGDFESYYKQQTERYIETIKERLDQ